MRSLTHPRLCRGFTLAEIAFVLAILAVLASIGAPLLIRAERTARAAEAVAQAGRIIVALRTYASTAARSDAAFVDAIDGAVLAPPGVLDRRASAGGDHDPRPTRLAALGAAPAPVERSTHLATLVARLFLAPDHPFIYEVTATIGRDGPMQDRAAICVRARSLPPTGVADGQIVVGEVRTTAQGWDGEANKTHFVEGRGAAGITPGGYCGSSGQAVPTCRACVDDTEAPQ